MPSEVATPAVRHRPPASLGWRYASLRGVARLLAFALAFTSVCVQCAMDPAAAETAAPIVAAVPHCHGDARTAPATVAPGALVICDDCLDPMPALPSSVQHDAGDHSFAHSFAVLPTHTLLFDHRVRVEARAPPDRRTSLSTPFTRHERLLI